MKLPQLVPLVFVVLAQTASADDGGAGEYSFGGSCVSQGAWTQMALSATANLRNVTMKLKDNPECKSLNASLSAALAGIDDNVKAASGPSDQANRLAQLPTEINALRSVGESSPEMQSSVTKMMMDKSIEQATLSAQVQAKSFFDVGTKVRRSAKTGMQLVSQIVDDIPAMERCVVGDGNQVIGSVFSTAVKLAASFTASGQDGTSSQLASTISKLTNLKREAKYARILRKLNQQEFNASMSCLMEITTESYCQARDSMRLFQKAMSDIRMRQSVTKLNEAGDPFVGYYILNTHVPNITKWLQKIQVGVDPKLPTDATFQNKIQQEVTDFYKSIKVLQGIYNSRVISINALPSVQAKQNALIQLVASITDMMTATDDTGSKTNFFIIANNSLAIPFLLIGRDQIPDQVAGRRSANNPTTMTIPYTQYFQGNLGNDAELPEFKNPNALIPIIERNMNAMIRDANLSAIEYFNKWYIVDKEALVNESTVDINYTVKDSLKAIFQYLDYAKQRITTYNSDPSSIPVILDTQIRIRKILDGYDALEKLDRKYANVRDLKLSSDDVDTMSATYESLIKTVYDQFNVMGSRSGFLANRMTKFVYNDYISLIKNKVGFDKYQQDLFYARGMAAFDQMMQIYNGNPANIYTDLMMAMNINNGNLEALELLIKDNFIAAISNRRLIENDKASSIISTFMDSWRRLDSDVITQRLNGDPKKIAKFEKLMPYMKPILSFGPASLLFWINHADRYPLRSEAGNATAPQSEFNEAAALHAQFCVQALAFNDQSGLYSLCHGSVLKSPIVNASADFDAGYDQKLYLHFGEKGMTPQMQKQMNHSDRVCAFRDYNRKNMVLFMGLGVAKTPATAQ